MNIKKKGVVFKKNIKKCGLIFNHNIWGDSMLGTGYVAVRRITCICYEFLMKLASP